MESYEPPSEDEEEITSKKKKKKDPNAPKRNMSAYFLYSTAIRSTIREEEPQATFGEIAKVCFHIVYFLRPLRLIFSNCTSCVEIGDFCKIQAVEPRGTCQVRQARIGRQRTLPEGNEDLQRRGI